MSRIAEARTAADPSSPRQIARRRRILLAAARNGARKGLDGIQMHEVARDAGVAISTLYRYFPSKTHLFTTVMADQLERFDQHLRARPLLSPLPEDTVAEVLTAASRALLHRPLLAAAMLRSSSSAEAAVTDVDRIDRVFSGLVLWLLGIDEPTRHDTARARLLLQLWCGVVQATLNGRISATAADADLRLGCRLLLAQHPCA